ncbi:CpaF family protein [Streptomyces sp. NPDC093088]|uniref:CpaF family protein n=1 Tax=Streptomyces sp. NPDC093088 TaxID=3366023 RepID=UPI0037F1DE93
MRADPMYPAPVPPPAPSRAPVPASGPVAVVPPGRPGVYDPRLGGQAAAPAMVGPAVVPQVRVDARAAGEIKRQVNDLLLAEAKLNSGLVGRVREQRARALINERVAVWGDAARTTRTVTAAEEQQLAALVFDMLFRSGRLQRHLDDPRVEDILINGHDRVFLKFSGEGEPVAADPVAESEEELQELVRDLIRNSGQSGRTFSTASPDVALRLPDGSRLQALHPEITGEHTFVTIRRHRLQSATLDHLVEAGAMDGTIAALLRACVRSRRNIIVVGEQSSGKTTLMRALLREIPQHERFGTIETEFELWAHQNGYHTQVVPMEARESNGERVDGRAVGEITLLDLMYRAKRMSLKRVVVGEVRGPEITAMMQALTSDRPGSMCTMHASEPHVVFDRIAELYLLARGNFSEQLAYRQIANGLHFVVFMSVDESGPAPRRLVSHIWEITGIGENGRPAYNEIFRPASEDDPRAVPAAPLSPRSRRRLELAGFATHVLDQAATWNGGL